jgi:hypothetical protein
MALPVKGVDKMFTPLSQDGKTGNLVTLLSPFTKNKDTGDYDSVIGKLYQIAKTRKFKYVVFDDVQYILLGIESMFKSNGEYKDLRKIYTQIKQFAYNMIQLADMEASCITTIYLWQKYKDKDDLVFPGIAFQNDIVVQGFFNVVLETQITMADEHVFKTNGEGLCKSPAEMFDNITIPNDIALVLKAMENYYN